MKILLSATFQRGALGHQILYTLHRMGHEVTGFDYRASEQNAGYTKTKEEFEKLQSKNELLLSIKGEFTPEKPKIPSALLFVDAVDRYSWFEEISHYYDHVFTGDPDSEIGTYLPLGVDIHTFRPINNVEQKTLIGFAGTCRQDRTDLIQRLHEKYNIKVYGSSWNKNAPYYQGSALYNEDLCKFYSSCKFIFNTTTGEGINSRIFETMAINGSVILTNPTKGILKEFQNGTHLLVYNDIEELCSLIEQYKNEEKERIRIANNAYKEILENFTLEKTLEKILEEQ